MNTPGIRSIEYIAASEVSTLPHSLGEVDISSHLTGDFVKLDIVSGAGPLKADTKEDPAGNYQEISLPFKIPGVSSDNDKLLLLISRKPHMFRITDVNGSVFLLGAQGIRARVDYTSESGKSGKGFRGYNCKLTTKALSGLLFLK